MMDWLFIAVGSAIFVFALAMTFGPRRARLDRQLYPLKGWNHEVGDGWTGYRPSRRGLVPVMRLHCTCGANSPWFDLVGDEGGLLRHGLTWMEEHSRGQAS